MSRRRRFLGAAGSGLAATVLSDSIARALAIPAHRATGTLRDIEHIVVLMQENRSFDHYFGVMRGVRGFGDPHPAILQSGEAVWYQADGAVVVPPFRPDVADLALTFFEDLDHGWDKTHEMFAREVGPVGRRQGPYVHGAYAAFRPAVPLRTAPMPSPSATPTTARCSARPIRTAITCGPAGTATTARGGGPVLDN